MLYLKSNFFLALFVLSRCPFDISAGVGAFVIGLSQISSFFSYTGYTIYPCIQRGAAVAEWLSSWFAEQEDRGSIPGLAT